MTKRIWKFNDLQAHLVRAILTTPPFSTMKIEIEISEAGGRFNQRDSNECMICIDVEGQEFDFGVAVLPDGAALGSKKLDIDDRFEIVDFTDAKGLVDEVIRATRQYWSNTRSK